LRLNRPTQLSPPFQEVLWAIAYEAFPAIVREGHNTTNIARLSQSVAALSRSLTRDRAQLPSDYLKRTQERLAYYLYFLPSNFLKIQHLIVDMAASWSEFPPKLEVLDLGCGPGTMGLGVIDFFAHQAEKPDQMHLKIVFVDHVKENVSLAKRTAHVYWQRLQADHLIPQDWKLTVEGHHLAVGDKRLAQIGSSFDWVIAANVLNELFLFQEEDFPSQARLWQRLGDRLLAPDGYFCFIEPALRETSQNLLRLRDYLISANWYVFAPCLSPSSPCPALQTGKGDWCHEERAWSAPPWIEAVDAQVGLIKDAIKFSYSILSKSPRNLSSYLSSPHPYRMVSDLMKSKGQSKAFLCDGCARSLYERQDKHANQGNHAFAIAHRGDVLDISGESKHRVAEDTSVQICF